MSYLKNFAEEIEKVGFLGNIGSMAFGGMTAWDLHGQSKELRERARLRPLMPSTRKLRNPQQYQFEGGKHTSLKPTTSPHSSLY